MASHRYVCSTYAPLALVLAGLLSLAACGEDAETPPVGKQTYSLQLDLRNFAPHASQRLEGRLVDTKTNRQVATALAVGAPEVTLFFGKVLVEGESYRVDFYADLDRNGEYTAPVGEPVTAWPDHQWRIVSTTDFVEGAASLANAAADVRLTMTHNTRFTDIDWPGREQNSGATYHSLQLNLRSFAPHAGQRIEGRVVDVDSGREVIRTNIVGAVSSALDFGRVLAVGRSYRVDFYADLNKDGVYTPPQGTPPTGYPDHQWRIQGDTTFAEGTAGLTNVGGAVAITMAHNATWTDIDWPGYEKNSPGVYTLKLSLTSFAPHAEQKIEGRVIDTATRVEVARANVVGAPEVSLDFGKVLVESHTYRVDFYADLNRDGAYSAPVGNPPTAWPDHQWRIASDSDFVTGSAGLANVAGNVALSMSHNARWTNIEWPK